MITKDRPTSEAFYEIAMACGRIHGEPLPKRLVEISDNDAGWRVFLNPTKEAIGDIKPYNAHIWRNEFLVGILDLYGGLIVNPPPDTEDQLIAWCKTIGV